MSQSVLYVEDDSMSRRVMKMLLVNRLGMDLVMLEDSTDFVDKVTRLERVPDVVFLDIHVMPHNGFEMLKMLREQPKFQTVPIVALTASVMNEEIQQLETAGFSGCLAKPIDAEVFPSLLERVISGESIWHITQ